MEKEQVKCLIIGSGPAGYTAAIYAGRANLSPVLYAGLQPGGQLTTTTEVENFPGYPSGIGGPELMEDLRKQAERFGTDIRYGVAMSADFSASPYKVTMDDGKVVEAQTVIIATGATAKYLGLDDEKKYAGMGVSACATCDGFFYRNRVVAVVGGGDTACEEASYLSGLASKVYLIVRKPFLRASKVMQQRVFNNPKIEEKKPPTITPDRTNAIVDFLFIKEGNKTVIPTARSPPTNAKTTFPMYPKFKIIDIAAPTQAPCDTPNKSGDTKGFRKTPWYDAPAKESALPTAIAAINLGNLLYITTRYMVSVQSPSICKK